MALERRGRSDSAIRFLKSRSQSVTGRTTESTVFPPDPPPPPPPPPLPPLPPPPPLAPEIGLPSSVTGMPEGPPQKAHPLDFLESLLLRLLSTPSRGVAGSLPRRVEERKLREARPDDEPEALLLLVETGGATDSEMEDGKAKEEDDEGKEDEEEDEEGKEDEEEESCAWTQAAQHKAPTKKRRRERVVFIFFVCVFRQKLAGHSLARMEFAQLVGR